MNNENWSKISDDISEVTKKIKSKIDEEDLVEDLKQSLNETINSASEAMKSIISTVENTINDDDIKTEAKSVLDNVNTELADMIKKIGANFTKTSFNHAEEE